MALRRLNLCLDENPISPAGWQTLEQTFDDIGWRRRRQGTATAG
jgi:hypothetical protein